MNNAHPTNITVENLNSKNLNIFLHFRCCTIYYFVDDNNNDYNNNNRGCLKKSFANLGAYINSFRGHVQCFEVS
jgi:hypothetical protein